jgi:VCBS repeat protein/FG-GAP repeat protein
MQRALIVAVFFAGALITTLGCTGSVESGEAGGAPAPTSSSSTSALTGGSGSTGGAASSSSSSSTVGSGGTGGTACVPVDDSNPCTDDVCENEVPVHVPTAAGTACAAGGALCDGLGACVACLAPKDCPGMDSACQARTCTQGTCGLDLAPAGTSCDDGDACTQVDTCQSGACVGATPVLCAAIDPCHAAGICDPATGVCSDPAQADGVACTDSDACTVADTCQAGVCLSGSPLVCNGGESCVAGACVIPECPGELGFPRVSVGGQGLPQTTVDVNGDGKPDLVVGAGGYFSHVGVLLGVGNGTFAPAVEYLAGKNPTSVAADLDGDGSPDLVVSNEGDMTGGAHVLLNQGNGTFAPAAYYPAGAGFSRAVALADINGDGKPDLLIAHWTGGVSLFLNQGNSTFAIAMTNSYWYPVCANPTAIAAADLNGDNKTDVVIGCDLPDSTNTILSVLIQQANGDFIGSKLNAGDSIHSIKIADLNGDGKPDLAVDNYYNGVDLYINQGNGNMLPWSLLQVAKLVTSIAVADLNGDGTLDVATADENGGDISVFFNLGNSTFAGAVSYSAGNGPASLAAADLNGDGKLDLAVASYSDVVVLFNNTCIP